MAYARYVTYVAGLLPKETAAEFAARAEKDRQEKMHKKMLCRRLRNNLQVIQYNLKAIQYILKVMQYILKVIQCNLKVIHQDTDDNNEQRQDDQKAKAGREQHRLAP